MMIPMVKNAMRTHRMGLQYFIPLWLVLSLFLGACNKKVAPAISQPQPVSKKPEPAPASRIPVPKIWPELPLPPAGIPAPPVPLIAASFHEAEASFDSGKFKEAIAAYDRYLQEDPTILYKAEAMFKLGMAHALACSAPECRASAVAQFKRLVAQFPKSPYSAQARVILSLQNDIERMRSEGRNQEEKIKSLTDELERLTKIILERQPPPIKK
jgi:tetratricopeptide (TPR) repeat protein